ncbi:MAG: class II aldolase/adducin family protein [Lentisphaerae bacterium]|nr:class II aldolase/adducin family protein [Lentisphaerota bacterium]
MNTLYLHPRDEIVMTMERIYRYKMTTTSGGNLSIRDENGDVWITPARVDKGALTPADVVRVRPDGSVDGRHPPSSELPFHLAIYRVRPDLRAVVHAHPMALVAFSLSHRVPETRVLPLAWQIEGTVGFAPYGIPGSEDLGRRIAAEFRRGFDSVIMENHGVCCGAADLQAAFRRFETLEFTAKSIIKARSVGPVRRLTPEQLRLFTRVQPSLRPFRRDGITTREKGLRRELCDFIERGYRQRLLTSAAGSFSARVGDDEFLVTPYPFDRHAIEPEDLVLVRRGRREQGRTPSRAAALHRALYRAHPSVGAIVNAHPVHATAFSICNRAVDTRVIPESYVLIREVSRLPFEMPMTDPEAVARRLTPSNPAAVLCNNGVMVVGRTVLAAFDQLEVLEYTAEALVDGRALGRQHPMPRSAIADLRRAFRME